MKKLRTGVSAVKGKRDYMEDEHVIIPNVDDYLKEHPIEKPPFNITPLFDELPPESPMELSEEIAENENKIEAIENTPRGEIEWRGVVGVFDGHGGDRAAIFARDHLHKYLFFETKFPFSMHQSIIDAFELTNDRFLQGLGGRMADDGSTAVVAVIEYFYNNNDQLDQCSDQPSPKGIIWCGNAGDSRCVMGKLREIPVKIGDRFSECLAIDLSIDHKPSDPIEKNRVLSRGGIVAQSNFMGFSLGPMRIFDERRRGGLAVARAIGDLILNHLVIATPDVTQSLFSSSHPFLLLASDGLWDVMTSQQAVDFVYKRFKKGMDATEIANELTAKSMRLHSLDNITALIVFL